MILWTPRWSYSVSASTTTASDEDNSGGDDNDDDDEGFGENRRGE